MADPGKAPPFERYVAIGDSTVEGLDDPDGKGRYRGWANRLATRIAREQEGVFYANLAIRGRTTRQVRDEQLSAALAMKPDLAIAVSGTNDLLGREFDRSVLEDDFVFIQRSLIAAGATVLTFTLPDLTDVMPLARVLRARLHAMNEALRSAASRTGAVVCDFARHSVASDPRLWSDDRLHANSAGHQRMAEALAYHLALPGSDMSWADPIPGPRPRTPFSLIRAEAAWIRRHLVPWIWRHARGRSSGDGISAKLPELTWIARGEEV